MNHQLPLARQAAALGISRGSLYYHPDRVTTMMRRMSIEAVYRRPDTSKPTAGHKSYPYLLRSLRIDQPNQASAWTSPTFRRCGGFVYLTVVLDWFSRRVLSWRVSIATEVRFLP